MDLVFSVVHFFAKYALGLWIENLSSVPPIKNHKIIQTINSKKNLTKINLSTFN
jgi:hypothetical protein